MHLTKLLYEVICHRSKNLFLLFTQVLTTIIGSVYHHVQLSTKRLACFKDMAELLEVDTLKFKSLFEIRWLSMGECVEALIRNYEPLMLVLSQEADQVVIISTLFTMYCKLCFSAKVRSN